MGKGERELAIKTIADKISQGFSKKSLRMMIERLYGFTSLAAQNKLIYEASLLLGEGFDTESIKQLNLERIEGLYELAIQGGKVKEAISAIDLQNKMLGIYNDNKSVKVSNDDMEFTITF